MADTLPKGYEPHDVEARWRDHWQDNRTFTPDPDAQGEPFSIVIPPPNVTGALHIGHALNQTLIDAKKAIAAGDYSGWYTLENPVGDTYIDTVRQIAVLKAWLAEAKQR